MFLEDPPEAAGSNRQASRERAFRLLAAVVAALIVAFGALAGLFLWYDGATREVLRAHQIREGISDLLQALSEAEAAERGYLLTSEPRFLTAVEAARRSAEASVAEVEALTADRAEQRGRIAALRLQMSRRMQAIDRSLNLGRAGDEAGAAVVMQRGEGQAATAAVRRLLVQFDQAEARLASQHVSRARTIRLLSALALVVSGLLLSALFIKAVRDISLDREAEAEMAERLGRLVEQRTLLLEEVNHRVKNSLQQIASVVRLQARATEHPETREALESTLTRILAVGRVHEGVYKSEGRLGAFDAGAYAETLSRDLVESMGREDVRLEVDAESAYLDMRQAAPLALILNELVTNALKYGCPSDRPCRIRVSFRSHGEDFRLTVADDGDGLPQGFADGPRKSLGMRAIQALAKQLGGRLMVERPKAGAAFRVEFPRSAT